jgi:putative ABC transport system permease protein
MNSMVTTIPLSHLGVMLMPVLLVLGIQYFWTDKNGPGKAGESLVAMFRMLIQLLLIGYVLQYIFSGQYPLVILAVLMVMLGVSSWISIRVVEDRNWRLYLKAGASILLGCVVTLGLAIAIVLQPEPLFDPRILIPLAGMTASNAMNTLSLTIERFDHERRSNNYTLSRNAAFQTAMIPQVNAFMAVGLVSLPGMMTGQVLAGIDPTIAARYQIVVMCLIFGASGIAAACYLSLNRFADQDTAA